MKKTLVGIVSLLALGYSLMAAAPVPPSSMLVTGTTTAVSTNALSAPVGFFPVALVYAPTNILKPSTATMLQWTANTETNLAGYNFYFGDILSATSFPKVTLPKAVNSTVMIGLNTNITYGFYVTAFNTSAEESAPSPLVVLKPGTLSP